MEILIKSLQDQKVNLSRLRQAARATMQAEQGPTEGELSIVLADDELVQDLNRNYRRVDRPTDVLVFPQGEEFAVGQPCLLGDVIISVETAQRQADERGHDLDGELTLLVIHGVLHILGWRDDTDSRRNQMWERQKAILESLAEKRK